MTTTNFCRNDGDANEMFLTTLGRSQCERIHEAAMELLDDPGVVFQSEEALSILKKGGARVDGDRVRIPVSMVERAIGSAPGKFSMYDREGNYAFEIGGRASVFGPGSDCLNILDHRTRVRRDPTVQDLRELVTMCDALPNIDFVMSMVLPADVAQGAGDRVQMETMLNCTKKPIIGVSFSYEGTRDIIEMAEVVAGGEEALRLRPNIIHYIQPVRVLLHNEDTVQKLIYTARKGLPVVYLVSANMGITSPITTAGYQAMGTAGQLAALVLAQLVREGTPVVVRGGRVVVIDMKTMLATIADPGNRNHSTDMAHYYGLPSFGTAGVSDSKAVDWQAVSETNLTLIADALVGASIIHDIGYIESGVTYSAEMLVLSDEIVSWVKSYKRGSPVNDETLALDLVRKYAFEGEFLTSEHTFQHFREQWQPWLFDRKRHPAWESSGSVKTEDLVRNKIESILTDHVCPALPESVRAKLANICRRADAAVRSA